MRVTPTGNAVTTPRLSSETDTNNHRTSSRKNFTTVSEFVTQPESRAQIATLEENVKAFGLTYFGMTDRRQGIVHIIGPEEGFTVSYSSYPHLYNTLD